jgi:hypothetical protein
MRLKLAMFWVRLCEWLNSGPCHKERMGYTCHHRIMSNGQKECD